MSMGYVLGYVSTPVAPPTCADRIPRTLARLCPPGRCTNAIFLRRQEFISRSITAPKEALQAELRAEALRITEALHGFESWLKELYEAEQTGIRRGRG